MDEIISSHRNAEEAFTAIEWQLARETDFTRYPVIGSAGVFGTIMATRTERKAGVPALTILFSVSDDDQQIKLFSVALTADIE
jgi:hypothetical protein